MTDDDRPDITNEETTFSREVGAQAKRKLKAQRNKTRTIWFGLGMSGLVGWSVTVPTVIGAAIGIWVDKHYPSAYSWTLMLLLLGLFIGCLNVWHWVDSEYKQIREDSGE